jgi:tRNA threonylcarbamoyladenosine biosynthesis protein TsaE
MSGTNKIDIPENSVLAQEKTVHSPQQTEKIACQLSERLVPGDVVALYGDLGTGKTFLVKAICRFFKMNQEATSPSFTIINEYFNDKNLYIYHFDFYRLKNEAEIQNLGLDEFFYNDYICLIEWPDKVRNFLPESRWEVYLNFVDGEPEARNIRIERRDY